jgi:hypothetical protein
VRTRDGCLVVNLALAFERDRVLLLAAPCGKALLVGPQTSFMYGSAVALESLVTWLSADQAGAAIDTCGTGSDALGLALSWKVTYNDDYQ